MKRNKKNQVNQETSLAVPVTPLTIGDLKNDPTIKEFLASMPDKVFTLPRMSRKELEALAIDSTNCLKGLVVLCEHLVALAESNKIEEPLWSLCQKGTGLARDMLGVNNLLLHNIWNGNECGPDRSSNARTWSDLWNQEPDSTEEQSPDHLDGSEKEITPNDSDGEQEKLLQAVAQTLGAGEHIKAICRMARNTMNSAHAKLDQQTLYSAFGLIEMLAGGESDDLFTMAEVYPNTMAEDFKEHD